MIAKENKFVSNRKYEPIRFIVGKGEIIKGFDEGIIGMKIGESKILTIPPEMGYGQKNPLLMQTIPIIHNIPIIRTLSKVLDIPVVQFNSIFGIDHKIGDSVKIPNSNVNLTILNINTTSNVSVSYNLLVGDKISLGTPWIDTVIKIDEKNITVKSEAKKNNIIQFGGVPWNTTVIDVNSDNMTLMHNKIPDTKTKDGLTRVHFNDTYITMDQNNELAGEILVFNVTIKSIN